MGYYNVFEQNQVYPEKVTAGLGEVFEGVNQSIKPFPGCCGVQNAIQAVLEVVQHDNIKPEDVEEITIRGNDSLAFFYTTPSFYVDLLIALAVVKRDIPIDTLAKDRPDPEVAEVAKKVKVFSDPEIVKMVPFGVSPAVVEIQTKDGKRHISRRVDYFHGHHTKSPMSMEELASKFRRNAAYAVNPVPVKHLNQAIDMLYNLEQVDDITRIVKLLG